MPNQLITPEQMFEELKAVARKQIAGMELVDVRMMAEAIKPGDRLWPGMAGGMFVLLVLAAQERLETIEAVAEVSGGTGPEVAE